MSGGVLFDQRVGASPQLPGTNAILLPTDANGVLTLGVTNQWHFYVITNDTSYTNAAFLTFLPENLAVTRMGLFEPSAGLATRPEADIDLYVAPPKVPNNYGLTNLDLAVLPPPTSPWAGAARRRLSIPMPPRASITSASSPKTSRPPSTR